MLCAVELVGIVVNKGEDSEAVPYLVLKIERPFLNKNQEVVYDEIIVYGWTGIMNNPKNYYQAGDYLCIKGRLENHPQFKVVVVGEYIRLLYRKKE